MSSLGRSAIAVVAGFAAMLAILRGVDFLIARYTSIGQVPLGANLYTPASLAVDLARLVVSVCLGGFVAASLAPRARLWHSVVMASIMFTLTVFQGIPRAWVQPVWYSVLTLIIIIPTGFLGGASALWRHRRG